MKLLCRLLLIVLVGTVLALVVAWWFSADLIAGIANQWLPSEVAPGVVLERALGSPVNGRTVIARVPNRVAAAIAGHYGFPVPSWLPRSPVSLTGHHGDGADASTFAAVIGGVATTKVDGSFTPAQADAVIATYFRRVETPLLAIERITIQAAEIATVPPSQTVDAGNGPAPRTVRFRLRGTCDVTTGHKRWTAEITRLEGTVRFSFTPVPGGLRPAVSLTIDRCVARAANGGDLPWLGEAQIPMLNPIINAALAGPCAKQVWPDWIPLDLDAQITVGSWTEAPTAPRANGVDL